MSIVCYARQAVAAILAISAMAIAAVIAPNEFHGILDVGQCCFTKCCPDGHGGWNCATDCISSCPSNKVCSGVGGCNGTQPWTEARCIDQPPP